ncbi:hypothetical protein [Tunturiibacter psychrotolerans]|uniref:hypothetical protein n=1 Tax=Tunturiibacter psychrotolerans TaxID=3069686 RepID=UPI003D205AD2
MRRPFLYLFTLVCLCMATVPAFATAYTAACTPLMMHVGDEVPPGIYTVVSNAAPTVQVGAGAAVFATPPPLCSPSATKTSTVGSFNSTMNPGTLANPGTDTVTYVNGTITVIAPTAINSGAKLNDSIAFPPGFFSAGAYPVINAMSNGICTPVPDGVTDNSDCLTYLFSMMRGGDAVQVSCTGTSIVTGLSGTPFTGITTGPMYINGAMHQIASVQSATSLTLVSGDICPTMTNKIARLPRTMVSTIAGNPVVTYVSGPQFLGAGYVAGSSATKVQLKSGFFSSIAAGSTITATQMTLATAPTFTSAATPMYNGNLFNGTTNAGFIPFFIYFPAGVYATSDQITPLGAYWSMWGDGPYKSIFKLLPNSAVGSVSGSFWNQNAVNTNNTYNVNIFNIGFELGAGNPSIDVTEYVPSNYAVMGNIAAWADDSKCPAVLNMSRAEEGPGLLKNFSMYGCAEAVLAGSTTFAMTGENITIQGQTSVGIFGNQLKTFWRHLFSFQPFGVPAMTNLDLNSSAVVMDSEVYALNGAIAFKNSSTSGFQPSTFFIKNTTLNGYTASITDCGTGTCITDAPGNITFHSTGTPQSLFDTAVTPNTLNLPVQETPVASDPPAATWCQFGDDISTWGTTMAGCGVSTIYAPPGQYGLNIVASGTYSITVPDSINHVNCNYAAPPPGTTYNIVFTIAGVSTTPLIIEGCPEGQNGIIHTGSRTVVILNDKTSSYTSSAGAGNLFCENCILGGSTPIVLQSSQSFWARQLNQEQPLTAKLQCSGCKMWILGYKTEHNGSNIILTGGAYAEIYGVSALGNPGGGPNGTMFELTDSSLFFTGTALTQCTITQGSGACNNQWTDWVTEIRLGVTENYGVLNATTVGGTENMGAFYSFGAAGGNSPLPQLFQIGNFIRHGRFN